MVSLKVTRAAESGHLITQRTPPSSPVPQGAATPRARQPYRIGLSGYDWGIPLPSSSRFPPERERESIDGHAIPRKTHLAKRKNKPPLPLPSPTRPAPAAAGGGAARRHFRCARLPPRYAQLLLVGRPFPALRSAGRCVVLEVGRGGLQPFGHAPAGLSEFCSGGVCPFGPWSG